MKRAITFAFAMTALSAGGVYAETLDEASIRSLYTQADGLFYKADEKKAFMEERLSKEYVLNSTRTWKIEQKPARTATEKLARKEFIEGAMNSYEMTTRSDYKRTISEIKIAPGRNSAELKQVMEFKGVLKAKAVQGQPVQPPYSVRNSCTDTLGLEKGKIMIMGSVCEFLWTSPAK